MYISEMNVEGFVSIAVVDLSSHAPNRYASNEFSFENPIRFLPQYPHVAAGVIAVPAV